MFHQQLPATYQQRDQGIIITKDLVAKTQRENLRNGQESTGVHCLQFQVQKQRTHPLITQIPVRSHLEHAVQFWSTHLRRDIDKIEKIQRIATNMIPEIRNHSYHQRIHDLDLISLVHRRLRRQLIEVLKYLNQFTTASARGLFDYGLNDRTGNNGAKLIAKHFNTSVAQLFCPIKITTTWNILPNEVVISRTVQRTLSRTAWTNTGQKIPQCPS